MNVLKRSGKKEPLTKKKVFDSICNANSAVDESVRLTQKQIKRITDTVVVKLFYGSSSEGHVSFSW